MQAILKSKHGRFCDQLKATRNRWLIADPALDELEKEMIANFNLYMQKREELRPIVQKYEEAQKNIRNRIKELQKPQYDLKLATGTNYST